jgi:hypothetical protein
MDSTDFDFEFDDTLFEKLYDDVDEAPAHVDEEDLMPAGEAVETILRDLDLPGTRDSGNYMI